MDGYLRFASVLRDRLQSSFWFLPSIMAISAIAMASLLILLDSIEVLRVGWITPWTYAFGPESARAILSAIAGSMITVAGVTFSITMLTLQLASSQFGPRMLRNFMRDQGNQIVLGTFLSTFVYCLLVLASVRGSGHESGNFVPPTAVTFGMLLAVASLATLIYFIHHIATSIRIETILAKLAKEACQTVETVFPEHRVASVPTDDRALANALPPNFDDDGRAVGSAVAGYIQSIDADGLFRVACDNDLVVRVEGRIGDFVTQGGLIAVAHPPERVSDAIARELCSMYVFGPERIPLHDVEFSLRRIVEIAQRALSPGVNDPTTALYCLDRLGEVLELLSERDMPSTRIMDQELRPRIVLRTSSFADLACPAFAAIARYGIKDDDLVTRLLDVMETCSSRAPRPDREKVMHLHQTIKRKSTTLSFAESGAFGEVQ